MAVRRQFLEVKAYGSGGNWVSVTKVDGTPFVASEVFGVNSNLATVHLVASDGRNIPSFVGARGDLGPLYYDAFVGTASWMWHAGAGDDRMGSVLGNVANNISINYTWSWYGLQPGGSGSGAVWVSRNSAAKYPWTAVSFSNNMFVAVASGGRGDRVMSAQ